MILNLTRSTDNENLNWETERISDIEKAFNSIEYKYIIQALRNCRVDSKCIQKISETMKNKCNI